MKGCCYGSSFPRNWTPKSILKASGTDVFAEAVGTVPHAERMKEVLWSKYRYWEIGTCDPAVFLEMLTDKITLIYSKYSKLFDLWDMDDLTDINSATETLDYSSNETRTDNRQDQNKPQTRPDGTKTLSYVTDSGGNTNVAGTQKKVSTQGLKISAVKQIQDQMLDPYMLFIDDPEIRNLFSNYIGGI